MSTPDSAERGRVLPVVVNDRESETRTPANRLYRIPAAARDPFTPCPPAPFIGPGEHDLTRLAPGRPQAGGHAIAITGRILDEDLRPVSRTLVEVWGANAHGRYSHVIDAGRNDAPLDPNFYGFGRLVTDDDGRYQLRTIKPGAYIARMDIGWWRPPCDADVLSGRAAERDGLHFPHRAVRRSPSRHWPTGRGSYRRSRLPLRYRH